MNRQEIAEFMRDTPAAIDENYQYAMPGNLFGLHITAKSEGALYGGLVHLAKLIDPTCEINKKPDGYGYSCSRCNSFASPNCHPYVNGYCPYCGARVVNINDAD